MFAFSVSNSGPLSLCNCVLSRYTHFSLAVWLRSAHSGRRMRWGGGCVRIRCGCLSVFPISVSHIRISSAVRQLRFSLPARCFVLPPNRYFVWIRPPLSFDKPAFVQRFEFENGNIHVPRGALQNGDLCYVLYRPVRHFPTEMPECARKRV